MALVNDILTWNGIKYIPDFIIIYPDDFITNNGSRFVYNEQTVQTYKIVTREMDDPHIVLSDYWYTNNQSFLYNANLFPYKVKNLYQMPFNISVSRSFLPYLLIDANVIIYPNEESSSITDGIEIRIFREYANRYNITLNFTIELVGIWGDLFENRTGYGLYGNVLEQKSNAALGGINLSSKAAKFIEYAYAVIDSRTMCLVPLPRHKRKFLLVLFPFTFAIWMVIVCSIITIAMAFSYMNNIINSIEDNRINNWQNEICNGFSKPLFSVYLIMLLQPLPQYLLTSTKFTHRFLFVLTLIQAVLISTAYTGGLAALITLPMYEKPIITRQDLLESKLEWGGDDVAWVMAILDSNDSQTIELLKTFTTYDRETLRKIPPRTFGFLVDELKDGSYSIPDYYPEYITETLQLMDEEIFYADVHAIFRKSSPFLLEYNKLVRRFQESGLIYQIIKQMNFKYHLRFHRREQRIVRENKGPIRFRIHDLESVFLLWSLGIAISCLIFGLEKYRKI